jgi:HEAT repeat protein
VRLRAALALVRFHDARAVETLITLLGELPAAQGRQAEEALHQLAGEQAPKVTLGDDAQRGPVRDAWLAWWNASEGTRLLDEFRKRTLTGAAREKAQALIRQLGDNVFANRHKAQAELEAMGPAVSFLVRQATGDADPEVSSRARETLRKLEDSSLAHLSLVVPRLVAFRKPADAAAVLLAFVPFLNDETLLAEMESALAAVAHRDGKLDPAVLAALADRSAVARAMAGQVLARVGGAEQRPAIRKLLEDEDPLVRQRVALTLADLGDRDAVPVLIALLGEMSPDQASPIESYLSALAGDKAPTVPLGNDEAGRKRCRDSWAAWWKDHGAAVDLRASKDSLRLLGYTLIVEPYDQAGRIGKLTEVDARGKVRWVIDGLRYPMDAQVLPNGRVLVAEQQANQVTERNLKGQVMWQKQVPQPVACQRLPNGNTFIVSRQQILEVDRQGKEVYVHNRPGDIAVAVKLRNGQIGWVSNVGTYTRMDTAGKELKRVQLEQPQLYYGAGGIDILPNDHVILPNYNTHRVVEYDGDGKVVWSANVQTPISATRLPNGNTLVGTAAGSRIIEIDKGGKTVWDFKDNIRLTPRLRRR